MKSNLRVLDETPAPHPNAGLGFEGRILRLVKGAPERQAIESGQVDAVMDPATGKAFLLPDAQQALREDQARSRSLLALSADWCWALDEHYRFVSHSVTASGSSGIYDEDIIGKTLWELPFDNMSEADWDTYRRQLKWRATFRDLKLRWVDRAGEVRWLSVSGEPVFDDQNRFHGYRGTARNIPGIKQADPPLHESNRFAARGVVSRKNVAERKRPERLPGLEHKVAKGAPVANSLLAALPRKDHRALLARLEPVTLTYGEVLYEPGEPIGHVYFPNDSVVSLLTTAQGNQALEVGLVGREGMVGISLALGIDVSSVRALVQGTGTAMRMKSARFHQEFRQCRQLQRELYRYAHTMLAEARQTAACSRFHLVEARLARWLLMTRDRVRSGQFRLTQEFLAQMLGVRRAGVTEAAGALQRRKLISYSRGEINILDGKALEAAACACYQILKDIADGARA